MDDFNQKNLTNLNLDDISQLLSESFERLKSWENSTEISETEEGKSPLLEYLLIVKIFREQRSSLSAKFLHGSHPIVSSELHSYEDALNFSIAKDKYKDEFVSMVQKRQNFSLSNETLPCVFKQTTNDGKYFDMKNYFVKYSRQKYIPKREHRFSECLENYGTNEYDQSQLVNLVNIEFNTIRFLCDIYDSCKRSLANTDVWNFNDITAAHRSVFIEVNKHIEVASNDLKSVSVQMDSHFLDYIRLSVAQLVWKHFESILCNQILKEISEIFVKLSATFNANMMKALFDNLCAIDKLFYQKYPHEANYVLRKHSLFLKDLNCICLDVIRNEISLNDRILFAQAIKYSVRNGAFIGFIYLFKILQDTDEEKIQNEIIYALAYQIRASKQPVEKTVMTRLGEIIGKIQNLESKNFLIAEIEKQASTRIGKLRQTSSFNSNLKMNSAKKKGPQTAVTKNKQTIQLSHKNNQSEETTMTFLSLANSLKSRNKQFQSTANCEIFPDSGQNGQKGSDRSIFRTTYSEVKYLYEQVMNGKGLKEDDELYLGGKFAAWNFGNAVRSILYSKRFKDDSLFIARMICRNFLEVSKSRCLEEATLAILTACVASLEELKQMILGPSNQDSIATAVVSEAILKQKYKGHPQIVEEAANKIYNCLRDIKLPWHGGFSCRCDTHGINNVVESEVMQIRLDAMTALYNCAQRNSAIITSQRLERIKSCLQDCELESIATKILVEFDFSAQIDPEVFQIMMTSLEGENFRGATEYLYQQSKDYQKCEKLFNKETLIKISKSLRRTQFHDEDKINCCNLLNNYLEHKASSGLPEEALDNYCYLFDPGSLTSNELRKKAMKSILLTAEKEKNLPQNVVDILILNSPSFGDEFGNFVLLAMGAICLTTKISRIDELSAKLLSDDVINAENEDIKFEKRGENNSHYPSISALAAHIFVNALQNHVDQDLNAQSLSHLIDALKCGDKQTRILAAKALYLAAIKRGHRIGDTLLMSLRDYVEDTVTDVAVYISLVVIHCLEAIAKTKDPIAQSDFEVLAKTYAFDRLKLGDEDFTDQINSSILNILESEARKQQFDENIFPTFDYILYSSESAQNHQDQVVRILECYTNRNYLIPKATIKSLEQAAKRIGLTVHETIQKVIKNGQEVSHDTLKIFVNDFYFSENDQKRRNALHLLSIAERNQDLPDEIFDAIELERAGQSIANSSEYQIDALEYLKTKTDKGEKLPINTLIALVQLVKKKYDETVLSVLSNVSNNKQSIPKDLMTTLEDIFDPKQAQLQLLALFVNIVKNHQWISADMTKRLESALNNENIVDKVLQIFAFLGQQGKELPSHVITKLCDKFLQIDDQAMKQDLLVAVVSRAESQIDFDPFLFQQVLRSSLGEHSHQMVRIALRGFKALIENNLNLQKESVSILVNNLTSKDHVKHVQEEISQILDNSNCDLCDEQKQQLLFVQNSGNKELLDQILSAKNNPNLLHQNFTQMTAILNEEPTLCQQAIAALQKCNNKQDIPDDLLFSLAIFVEHSDSLEIIKSCLKLINEIKALKILPDRVSSLLKTYEAQQQAKFTLSLIEDTQKIAEIEQKILLGHVNNQTLADYLQVLKAGRSQDPISVVGKLTDLMGDIKEELSELERDFIECISIAASQNTLSSKGVEVLQEYLETEDPEIRSKAFKGLRAFLKRNENCQNNEYFNLWCQKVIERLEACVGVLVPPEQQLDLLDAVVSLKKIDYLNLSKPFDVVKWSRDLLLGDLFSGLELIDGKQKLDFYEKWKDIEFSLDFQDGKSLELLKILHERQNRCQLEFDQLIEVFDILLKIGFTCAKEALMRHGNYYTNLKKQYLKTLIRANFHSAPEEYLDDLSSRIAEFPFGLKLLNAITVIRNLPELENLLHFISTNNVQESDIYMQNFDVPKLRRSIAAKLLGNEIQQLRKLDVRDHNRLALVISNLFDNKWTFEKLKDVFRSLNMNIQKGISGVHSEKSFKKVLRVLEILNYFRVPPKQHDEVIAALSQENPDNWLRALNTIAVASNFQVIGSIKSTKAIIQELRENNQHGKTSKTIVSLLEDPELLKSLREVASGNTYSRLLKNDKVIAEWKRSDITKWTNKIKNDHSLAKSEFNIEALTVIKQANLIATRFHMTDSQILSCLLAVTTNHNQGRLLQVATGEGKSTIICVLATIHALKGKNVDIVTSSPILAERDSREKAEFYKIFGIECSANNEKDIYITGARDCYRKQIV